MKNLLVILGIFLYILNSAIAQVTGHDAADGPVPGGSRPMAYELGSYDSVRVLNEINVTGMADAYPWLSGDGLRLYFTKDTGSDYIYYTYRNNVNSYFTTPVPLDPLLPAILSCWLSANELDIYFIQYSDNQLYYASRSSVTSSFGAPVHISLSGVSAFISGPSLSPAQDELYLYNNSAGAKDILRFTRTSATSFAAAGKIIFPPSFSPGPGQLSKDGLSFYLSDYSSGIAQLHQMTRASLSDPLDSLKLVPGINSGTSHSFQPSMSYNSEWVAFCRSTQDTWSENDLYIAHNGTAVSVFSPERPGMTISLYPNPANDRFSFSVNLEKQESIGLIIYSSLGQKVRSSFFQSGEKIDIEISDLQEGFYLVEISGKEFRTIEKLIVRR